MSRHRLSPLAMSGHVLNATETLSLETKSLSPEPKAPLYVTVITTLQQQQKNKINNNSNNNNNSLNNLYNNNKKKGKKRRVKNIGKWIEGNHTKITLSLASNSHHEWISRMSLVLGYKPLAHTSTRILLNRILLNYFLSKARIYDVQVAHSWWDFILTPEIVLLGNECLHVSLLNKCMIKYIETSHLINTKVFQLICNRCTNIAHTSSRVKYVHTHFEHVFFCTSCRFVCQTEHL